MKSINKTKNLWNNDLTLKGLKDDISPMCCWFWCWYYRLYHKYKMNLFPSSYNYSYKINSRYTLINNTLTGALDIIENNIWSLVEGKKFNSISSEPPVKTYERGYFYSNLKKEDEILVTLYDNYIKKASGRPLRFVFCPSYQCNLRCIYCFETELPFNPYKYMNEKFLTIPSKPQKKYQRKNPVKSILWNYLVENLCFKE